MGDSFAANLVPVNIEDEMKKSYLDYAMSVIIGRALPDARDGLKPVHRRVLFAMNELGNVYNKSYKKSARIVGDVIGKYHPHGDVAVYDAIVRMVQPFSMRYPLVDGQGNFGSVDGDAAAAMRYTEVRMARIAGDMLADIDKETVGFLPNYDESLVEPDILPTRVPNLLVNGTSGIAVGMATNIPPHNLGEVIDALIHLIDQPDTGLLDLMALVPGPDFPTGGFIYGRQGIIDAYKSGRGIIRIRARAEVEETENQRPRIVINEIPFQVNKSRLIEQIAGLVRERKLEGIADIRDESDREGMRIVLEIRRDEEPEIILNNLYKSTQLQVSFGINLLAIDRNQPKLLNLKSALEVFIEHRRDVVTRRTRFDLRKARERAHILEGLKIALENLDEVIRLIRESKTPAEARERLIHRFSFSEAQAQAILDMRLQRLTNLEQEKILEEYGSVLQLIDELESILASDFKLMEVIKSELQEIRRLYSDKRRTEILDEAAELDMEDLIPDEDVVITLSNTGYIKRTRASEYRVQRRGGKGRRGMTTRAEDFTEHAFVASTHSYILIFTDQGRLHWLKVYAIPEVGTSGRGRPVINLLRISREERIADMIAVKEFAEDEFVVFATARGLVKKTSLAEFSNPRVGGIVAQTVREGDRLISAVKTTGDHQIFLASRNGLSIRFHESDVRPMGRAAQGVIGIRLEEDDEVVSLTTFVDDGCILTVTEKGFGKKTPTDEYRLQSRGGKGIRNLRISAKNGSAVGSRYLVEDRNLFLVTAKGQIIRMNTEHISTIGRSTLGVKLIDLDEADYVTSLTLVDGDDGPMEEITEDVIPENGQ